MNWRNASPFAAAAGAVAFLALILLWWTHSNFASAADEFRAASSEQRQLESGNPYPSDANVRKVKGYLADYGTLLDRVKAELNAHTTAPGPLAPNEFQSRLVEAISTTAQDARAARVKLPDNFKLGFDEFVSRLPQTEEASKLGQELRQVQLLLRLIMDARVDAITMFKRVSAAESAPAPAGGAATPASSPRPAPRGTAAGAAPTLDRRVVEFTVAGSSNAVRKLLNQISSSDEQFFIVRTLHVKNQKDKGPSREAGAATPSVAPAPAVPAPSASATPALKFIVGEEHLNFSARVELVSFHF